MIIIIENITFVMLVSIFNVHKVPSEDNPPKDNTLVCQSEELLLNIKYYITSTMN